MKVISKEQREEQLKALLEKYDIIQIGGCIHCQPSADMAEHWGVIPDDVKDALIYTSPACCVHDGDLQRPHYCEYGDQTDEVTTTEVTMENLENAVNAVRVYDPKTQEISILKDALDALEDLLKYEINIDDLIDFSDLPTLPIPSGEELYPIWAMDYKGNCLVGDVADQIENISEIVDDVMIIGSEKVTRFGDDNYVITPIDAPFFVGDDGTPHEVTINHNGEEWICGARMFKSDNIDDTEFETMETESAPGIYLKMLPEIRQKFGDDV